MVVIGIYIIGFVVISSGVIVYEMAVEGKDYPPFSSLEFGLSGFNYEEDTGSGVQTVEGGGLVAVRGDYGITNPKKWGVGLAGEIGGMSGTLSVAGGETYTLTGVYGLVGPVLQIFHGIFQMDLLAGTNTQPEVGTMSVIRLRARVPLRGFGKGLTFDGPYLAISWGTIYIGLKEELGGVQDKGKFNELWGLNFGYAF